MLDQLRAPWLKAGEKLICFGDSLTAADPGYVAILQRKLGAHGIEVIRAGRGGDKTPWALTRLVSDVIEKKPDAVNIFLGTNDAAVGRGIWADEPHVEPEVYKGNLIWMIHLCRQFGNIRKFSITTPTASFESDTLLMHGDVLTPYCRMAREAAEESQALLVPLDVLFTRARVQHAAETSPDGKLYTTDGTHMTPEGNLLIAEAMLKTWHFA